MTKPRTPYVFDAPTDAVEEAADRIWVALGRPAGQDGLDFLGQVLSDIDPERLTEIIAYFEFPTE